MSKNIFFIRIIILFLAIGSGAVVAKGGELKFGSIVVAVSQTGTNEGTIEVTIHNVAVPVIVNGDTEISGSGEEIGIAAVSAGDFVKINSFFAEEGLIADEVEVLDVRDEQFRLRGAITAITSGTETSIITLLGVDVTANADTEITRRGDSNGNSVPASDLVVGDLLNVSGGVSDNLLVANRIHVGSREQGNIELEGEIVTLSDTQVSIAIEGGATVAIAIDDETSIVGELSVGVFVEVEGQLLADLSLIGFEIVADVDGDGDADDDNKRGKKGDKNSNRGRDDDSDDQGTEVGAEIVLARVGAQENGKAEYSFSGEGASAEQELEVELEDGEAAVVYSIIVFFGADSVEFGDFTSDARGDFEVKYRSGGTSPETALDELLPEGKDVRDITSIQITQDGSIVAEGTF